MGRPLRTQYPGAFYHVYNRGVEKRKIFLDKRDYEKFLSLCHDLHKRFQCNIHSYALMPNHYHLYVETPQGNLSKIMQQLDGRYTRYFNWKHERVGPLFQSRYKSNLITEESYGIEIARYIHLNPVEAKLADQPENYPWSSYAAFVGKQNPAPFLKTAWLLSQFGESKEQAINAFQTFTYQLVSDTVSDTSF